ncbi:MAG: 3-hydroxyacyl-CoA dehydrogenase NAD-binding domain-containing protein [Roseovarius sp.]|nr:3-hydroxyacyl-CoA dehydrogenase NAD-binding domain-containing protein [Roseovarius sp.]
MSVTMREEDNVGYVLIDNPPVNAIGVAVRQGLLDAVRRAEEAMLDRVIIAGKGRIFAAGADAREFDSAPIEPHLPDVLNAIDESFVPWVAAINGAALGGGAEIAMACRMRIMGPRAQIGLPEVNLGVIPGAGGTQRLPRLVGIERALDMITSGKPLGAHEALSAKLVHAVDDDPVEAAYMINSEELGCVVPSWELPAPAADAGIFESARGRIAIKSRGQIAPAKAIEVIEAGLTLPFHEALPIERAAFIALRDKNQAKALRHMFFAERAAKAPAWLKSESVALDNVAVIGGGMMGSGIAYALLNSGCNVTLIEVDGNGAARAAENVDKIANASLKRGLITREWEAGLLDRLNIATDIDKAKCATLAIEAAFESMEVKKEIFAALDAALPGSAVLATNTSYLDVNEIASSTANATRIIGLHFFAPAHVMKLLEVVRGDATGDVALATGYALARKLRKIPVVAGVCDGFIGNRILSRYREAADTVLMDGSTPWEIDEAMVDFGYAMGPYETQDLSGLDIAHANRRRQDQTRNPDRRYMPIADRMVELGRLGRKTGAGWYRYPGGQGKVEDPIVADIALEEARFAGIARTEYTPEEIRDRLLLAMINESANILHEGIAQTARDIDVVTVFGYGFPRWRGGLMKYADTMGARHIVNRLKELEKEDPIAWKVSPLLQHCASTNGLMAEAKPEA